MPALTVGVLAERLRDILQLEVLGSADGLRREVTTADASGPGMVLAGYTGRFVHERIQVFGETEISYLRSLGATERERIIATFFGYPIPCAMVTKGLELPDGFEESATRHGVAILRSQLK